MGCCMTKKPPPKPKSLEIESSSPTERPLNEDAPDQNRDNQEESGTPATPNQQLSNIVMPNKESEANKESGKKKMQNIFIQSPANQKTNSDDIQTFSVRDKSNRTSVQDKYIITNEKKREQRLKNEAIAATIEVTPENQTIHYFAPDSYDMYVFDLQKRRGKRIPLNIQIWKNFDSVQIKHLIYINGGYANGMQVKSHYQYLHSGIHQLKKKKDMQIPKSDHTLIAVELSAPIPDQNKEKNFGTMYIYSVGGLGDSGLLCSCEKYDIEKNAWTIGPNLSEQKSKVGACSFQSGEEIFIYSFGGCGGDSYFKTIERLCLGKEKEWEIVNLGEQETSWKGRYESGCYQISDIGIIIFGGYDDNLQKDCYIFNPTNNSIRKIEVGLQKDEQFFERKGLKNEKGEFFIIGHWFKDVHIFNINDQKWRIIDQFNWHPKIKS